MKRYCSELCKGFVVLKCISVLKKAEAETLSTRTIRNKTIRTIRNKSFSSCYFCLIAFKIFIFKYTNKVKTFYNNDNNLLCNNNIKNLRLNTSLLAFFFERRAYTYQFLELLLPSLRSLFPIVYKSELLLYLTLQHIKLQKFCEGYSLEYFTRPPYT